MKELAMDVANRISELESEQAIPIGEYTIEKDYFVTDTINIIQSVPASDFSVLFFAVALFWLKRMASCSACRKTWTLKLFQHHIKKVSQRYLRMRYAIIQVVEYSMTS